jgi:TonB family protein
MLLGGNQPPMANNDNIPESGLISAVTGGPVEGLLHEPKRSKYSKLSAIGFYIVVAIVILLTPATLPDVQEPPNVRLPNLVFVAEPGPGGGGGGGGENNPEPESVQKVAGEDQAQLALKVEEPKEQLVYEDEDKPDEPEEEEPEPEEEDNEVPEVKAPVVAQAPDDLDQKGILEGPEQLLASAGMGNGGGSGTGNGTGIGEGDGSGIGPGWGGGFGGGAYRIGSGIEPPTLRRQVQPEYTDKALARKIAGSVLLEVIILKDGTVGPIRVLQSLEPGLDEKAIEAVRKWLFVPGKHRGQPVDVIAEIFVDFNLI